jgi:hypothetical protein
VKNILFVSSNPPFKLFTGGDTQSEIIINFLKKKFNLTIAFWDNTKKFELTNNSLLNNNILRKILQSNLQKGDYEIIDNIIIYSRRVYNKLF